MMIAQQLYEGIELPGEGAVGLITYMRTDSTRVADQALTDVREFIGQKFGPDYLPEKPIYYKAKADAQDAHEAIRPTSMLYHPDEVRAHLTAGSVLPLPPDLEPLRRLADAAGDVRRDDGRRRGREVPVPRQGFGAEVRRLDGGLQPGARRGIARPGRGPDAASAEDDDGANVLPVLNEGDRLELRELKPEQKFTQPPPRYSEATLVKALEENGIGRPSTYASIIGVIQTREYVNKIEGALQADAPRHDARREAAQPGVRRHPRRQLHARARGRARQDRGRDQRLRVRAVELLQEVREGSEARRQGHDQPEGGRRARPEGHVRQVRLADGDQGRQVRPVPGLQRAIRSARTRASSRRRRPTPRAERSRRTARTAASRWRSSAGASVSSSPARAIPSARRRGRSSRRSRDWPPPSPTRCSTRSARSASRTWSLKQGRFGEFTACSNYPACKYVKQKSTGVLCPKDGGDIVERKSRRGRVFFGCANYPACDFTLWNRPMPEKCPDCGAPFLVEKITKRHGRQLICNNEECSYVRSEELAPV